MPEQPPFPPEVQAFLGEIYRVTMPKQGATSQVWIVECAAGMRVVKHASRVPYVDWLIQEEFMLLVLWHWAVRRKFTVPIPDLFFVGGTSHEPYLIMSWLPGEPLATVMTREDDPTRRLDWMSAFGKILRQIHDTPVPEELLHGASWLDERLNTAADYIRAGFELDAEDPPKLLELLQTNRPAPVPETLIHGDFMWDNVLVEDGRITGIIDWGGGAFGDPRYDLALAILPHEDGEISAAEVNAFYEGYGCEPLSDSDYHYFINLYGFF